MKWPRCFWPAGGMKRPISGGLPGTRRFIPWTAMTGSILRVSARAQPPGAPGSERNVFPSVERPQLPAGNPGRRVDAHLILGKSYRQIAHEEGVDKSAVRCSVESGIKRMKKYLKRKFLNLPSPFALFCPGYMRGSFFPLRKEDAGPQATVPGRRPLCGGAPPLSMAVL